MVCAIDQDAGRAATGAHLAEGDFLRATRARILETGKKRAGRTIEVACLRTSKLGGAWGQPPAAITNPPAKHVTAAMKRAISDGVNVQSLRMLRLNCWTIPATQRFFETLKNG
jgi:hypothetical protein